MATNFPGSLDTYTPLVDGTDILEAADQNNVRDAVEALEAKVGIDTSGVATSCDYRLAQLEGGSLVASGANVFNASMTAASTFQNLDLSGTVGSNSAIVFLEVSWNSSGAETYVAQTNGRGGTWTESMGAQTEGNPHVIRTTSGGATRYGFLTMMTDASGLIEHGFTDNTTTVVIDLIGYTK